MWIVQYNGLCTAVDSVAKSLAAMTDLTAQWNFKGVDL